MECMREHFCISKRVRPAPRSFARIQIKNTTTTTATITFVRPDIEGVEPTVLYVVEGDLKMSGSECMASSNTIPRRGNRGRIMLQDLDPGTKYGMLWFVACSTVNANSCQQLDAQECSLPIKIPPLTTEMPGVLVFHW